MAANSPKILTALELCAGGGGQALGLELAGFHHAAAVEYEKQFCTTLRKNRPHWNVCETDIRNISGKDYKNVDVVAAGVVLLSAIPVWAVQRLTDGGNSSGR